MPSEVKRVVILYEHPLLGEGLGRLLTAQPDLRVELVHLDDECSADNALSSGPDVVILERTTPLRALDYLRSAPGALFIDVGLDPGPSWTYRRDAIDAVPDELVRAIHASRTTVEPGSDDTLPGPGPAAAGVGPRVSGERRTLDAPRPRRPRARHYIAGRTGHADRGGPAGR